MLRKYNPDENNRKGGLVSMQKRLGGIRFPLKFMDGCCYSNGNVPILEFCHIIGFHQHGIGHALAFDLNSVVTLAPESFRVNTV